jgi:hypothetical protein
VPSHCGARLGRLVSDGATSPYGWIAGSAPIAQWETIDGYDTATACASGREQKKREQEAMLGEKALTDIVWKQLVLGVCIATDDPRLKEK